MFLWTKRDFTVHLTFTFFRHFMVEFAPNRIIRTFFLVVVVMSIFNMGIIMNIHSFILKRITQITFVVLGFSMRFQVFFVFPTSSKSFIAKVTYNAFLMVYSNGDLKVSLPSDYLILHI